MNIGQSIYRLQTEADIYTIIFTLQVDSKDNKYRYRIFDIKHTVTGKDETSLFAKYLVNVTAETDNGIVKGELKGYSKGQQKAATKAIDVIDAKLNKLIAALQNAVNVRAAKF